MNTSKDYPSELYTRPTGVKVAFVLLGLIHLIP
jgi:hypothetical protein